MADRGLAGGGGVPLVEDEVDDPEDAREPIWEQLRGWHAKRDPRLADPSLCPHEPLGQSGLGDEEGPGDLGRRQAPDLPKRQRDLGVERERGVAAGECQREPLVGNRVHVILLGRELVEPGEQRCLSPKGLLAPEPVDRPVAGGGDDPGAGVARRAVLRPALERLCERVLHRVLGEVEIAEDAGEDGDAASPLFAIDACEVGQCSTSGLISIEP